MPEWMIGAVSKTAVPIYRDRRFESSLLRMKSSKEQFIPRPPVVVVLGHVDHGKTSILDYIRKTHVVEKEVGGITQHIGAYQIEHQNKLITFIDTPGHAAFETMREHGAKIADIAVLVVAADEGVKPQTIEAIKHCQNAKIPIIVAINKIDKKESDLQKVKGQLEKQGIIIEEKGGEVVCCEISAKTGQGIDHILEMILLVGEMEELKGNPDAPAQGTIIESHLDSRRGPTATVLLYDGSLELGDEIKIEGLAGKIKTMEDFQGQRIKKALPSMPVVITGFKNLPPSQRVLQETTKALHTLILKSDTQGTLQAIIDCLKDKKNLNILEAKVGNITEDDIKKAIPSKARVVGFNVKISSVAKRLAEQELINLKTYDIIYQLLDDLEKLLAKAEKAKPARIELGQLKVLAIFRTEKNEMIIGGEVIEGKMTKGAQLDVVRNEQRIGTGKLFGLQEKKKDINEVAKGKECGIKFRGEVKIQEGDILKAFNVSTN